jgi:hypothetical protein
MKGTVIFSVGLYRILAPTLAENWPFLQIQLWPKGSWILVFGWIFKMAHTTTAMFSISTFEKLILNCQTSLCLTLHVRCYLAVLMKGAISIMRFLQTFIVCHESMYDIIQMAINPLNRSQIQLWL